MSQIPDASLTLRTLDGFLVVELDHAPYTILFGQVRGILFGADMPPRTMGVAFCGMVLGWVRFAHDQLFSLVDKQGAIGPILALTKEFESNHYASPTS